MGDPAEAERSQVLDNLREDLENKKYLIDRFFGRDDGKLCIQFRSAQTRKVGVASHQRTTRTYTIELSECLSSQGPNNEKMLIGFIRLIDLWRMFNDMGTRFFERNIRFALPETESVSRALSKAFKSIILNGKDKPSVFAFNHNGVCLAAENIEKLNGQYKITEPRLINGVQTITTFERFIKSNEDNPTFRQNRSLL